MTFLSIKFSQPVRTIIKREETPQQELVSLKNDALRDVFLEKCKVNEEPLSFSKRQRVAFTVGTRLPLQHALEIDDSDICKGFFKEYGVKWPNIRAANMSIVALHQIGFDDVREIRALGMATADLVSCTRLARDMVAVYGAPQCRNAFLSTPSDAVMLAGSEAMHVLDVSVNRLYKACDGCYEEAQSVFTQLSGVHAVRGVEAINLLNAGITSRLLLRAGFNAATLSAEIVGSNEDVAKLVPKLF